MHLKFRETDIVGFVDDLMQTFDYQLKKNISFCFTTNLGITQLITQRRRSSYTKRIEGWVDLNNFDKVLLNVLSNAFKYTPQGGNISVNLSTVRMKHAEEL
jgi:signal transduction histidine kinase